MYKMYYVCLLAVRGRFETTSISLFIFQGVVDNGWLSINYDRSMKLAAVK